MSTLRTHAAVPPSVDDVVAAERPEDPMHCLRPATVRAVARAFVEGFPGDVTYEVKCNPEPAILRALHRGGAPHCDCAFISEVRLVRQMSTTAEIRFIHPVKARGAIREAWASHSVRSFVLDSADELGKIRNAGVPVDVLDFDGGFPAAYPDIDPSPLGAFIAEIESGVERLAMPNLRLWAEPGRARVAGGTSVVVQVQRRRRDALYINDGVFGTLAYAGTLGFRYPVRLIRPDGPPPSDATVDVSLFGPTCDSADRMRGPFVLPDDVREEDWIEIGQLGAYGGSLRTVFNGFDRARLVEVRDAPLLQTAGYAPESHRLAA